MAKMLRNTPNGIEYICRCRHCRRNDRHGVDSMARRAQRARESATWKREVLADAIVG